MSNFKLVAAVEEFIEETAAELTSAQTDPDEIQATDEGILDESQNIDQDLEALASSGEAIESIINLVEGAPTQMSAPLDNFTRHAVRVALEANDLIASSGGAVALTEDKGATKKDFLDKAKDLAKKIWETLASMAGRILEWIKGIAAKVTDRLTRNANAAKKHLETIGKINSRAGAKIEDQKILNAVANAKGADVGEVVLSVFDFAKQLSEKNSLEAAKQASGLIQAVATGNAAADSAVASLVRTLTDTSAGWAKGTQDHAAATKAGNDVDVVVSPAFFTGAFAYMFVPKAEKDLKSWNHGFSKLEKVRQPAADAPDVSELKAICEYIINGQQLVRGYQESVKALDKVSADLKAAVKNDGGKQNQELVRTMQAVVPRIVKGPQVLAFNYAGTASSIALAYVGAALKAHSAPEQKENA